LGGKEAWDKACQKIVTDIFERMPISTKETTWEQTGTVAKVVMDHCGIEESMQEEWWEDHKWRKKARDYHRQTRNNRAGAIRNRMIRKSTFLHGEPALKI